MKSNAKNKVVSTFVILFALVAIFVMFAPAFSEDENNAFGNVYQIMFANLYDNLTIVPLLIVGFTLLLAVAVFTLAGYILGGKAAKALFGFDTVALIATAVLFFFEKQLYMAANSSTANQMAGVTGLGAGAICVIVFALVGAFISLLGVISKQD